MRQGATEERLKNVDGGASQTYVTSSALRPLEEEIEGRWRCDDEGVKA